MSEAMQVDTGGLEAFIRDLSRMSGKDFLPVVVAVCGQILDLCIARSPKPYKGRAKSEIQKSVRDRVQKPGRYIGEGGTLVDPITKRAPRQMEDTPVLQTLTGSRGGERGREWYVGRNRAGTKIFLPQERMITNRYRQLSGLKYATNQGLEPAAQAAVAAIGAVKASWLQIAAQINAPLKKYPGWLKQVRSPYDDGKQSHITIDSAAAFVDLVNTNGMLIRRYDGGAILQGAVDTRLKAYGFELRTGVFNDIAMRAKRYPGIFIV